MFFNSVGKPNALKKTAYLFASTILGLFLSFYFHAFIEIIYLSWVESRGWPVAFYGICALLPQIQIGIWILGAVGGFFLGRTWWRKVYIERVWANKPKP